MTIKEFVRNVSRMLVSIAVASAFLVAGRSVAQGDPQGSDDAAPYFTIVAINPSLAGLSPDANLETPRACVEQFVLSSRQGQWQDAAAALNFRLLGDVEVERAATVARHFFYVLNQELWIDWSRLSDVPDGRQIDSSPRQESVNRQARRTIRLGAIEIEGRPVSVNVERLKPAAGEPVWLFSAHTVDNIDALWKTHGPSWLARQMPDWARQRWHLQIPIWQWVGGLSILILAPVVGYLFAVVFRRWIIRRSSSNVAQLCERLQWPMASAIAALLIWSVWDGLLGLPSQVAAVVEPLSLSISVAMVVWLAMRVANFVVERVLTTKIRDYHKEESASRKRLLTQVAVARQVLVLVLVLLGMSVVLLQLDIFRTLGMTLLTSAGALAVVLSLAGRAVIGNLIAGLQIALAQPFRIGDVVHVENNWGKIEDMTYVDVIVRTWDERRLVFPVGYFISNWFENWSKTDPYLIKANYLQVDYRADVEAIRSKFIELVKNDEAWAGEPDKPEVLVTEFNRDTMTVRLTCGGEDPSQAWTLSCRVCEQLMRWLQEVEDGRYLPRHRLSWSEPPESEPDTSKATAEQA